MVYVCFLKLVLLFLAFDLLLMSAVDISDIVNLYAINELCGVALTGIQLRSYQLDGVQWLTQCLKNQQGCILGDEMGLGKTCQV